MIKSTITFWNVVKKILEKLDMAMFGVKYLKKWTSVFCEIGVVFFLISSRLTSSSVLVWFAFYLELTPFREAKKSHFFDFEALYLEGWLSKGYEILLVCKNGL